MERIRVDLDPLTAQLNANGEAIKIPEPRFVTPREKLGTPRSVESARVKRVAKPQASTPKEGLFPILSPDERFLADQTKAAGVDSLIEAFGDAASPQIGSERSPLAVANDNLFSDAALPTTEGEGEKGSAGFKRLLRDLTEAEEEEDIQIRDLMVGKMLEEEEREQLTASQKMRKADELFGDVDSGVVVGNARKPHSATGAGSEVQDTDTLLEKLDDLQLNDIAWPTAESFDRSIDKEAPKVTLPSRAVIDDMEEFNFDEYIQKEGKTSGGGLFD